MAVGEWAWGDNDTIGYDTLYVRINGDADPDTQDSGYVQAIEVEELLDSGANTIVLLSLIICNNDNRNNTRISKC